MALSGFLALIWGLLWALFLQKTALGRYLAARRTWATVVAGVGVDLLIAKRHLSWGEWLNLVTLICLSSVPIIGRSLLNEWADDTAVINAIKNKDSQ
jgi:hypothetical protein